MAVSCATTSPGDSASGPSVAGAYRASWRLAPAASAYRPPDRTRVRDEIDRWHRNTLEPQTMRALSDISRALEKP